MLTRIEDILHVVNSTSPLSIEHYNKIHENLLEIHLNFSKANKKITKKDILLAADVSFKILCWLAKHFQLTTSTKTITTLTETHPFFRILKDSYSLLKAHETVYAQNNKNFKPFGVEKILSNFLTQCIDLGLVNNFTLFVQ